MNFNTGISANPTTVEPTSHRRIPDPPRLQGRLARRLAGPGWVIMTLACVTITVIVSRYLTFDPEVYFPQQLEPYLQHEFALGVHVLSGMLALLIGPFQFVRRLRRRFVPVHRFMGGSGLRSTACLPRSESSTSPSRRRTPRLPGCAGSPTCCSRSGSPATPPGRMRREPLAVRSPSESGTRL